MEHVIINPEPPEKPPLVDRPRIMEKARAVERSAKPWIGWVAAAVTSAVLLIIAAVARLSLSGMPAQGPEALIFGLLSIPLWLFGLVAATFGLLAGITALTAALRSRGSISISIFLIVAGLAMVGWYFLSLFGSGAS